MSASTAPSRMRYPLAKLYSELPEMQQVATVILITSLMLFTGVLIEAEEEDDPRQLFPKQPYHASSAHFLSQAEQPREDHWLFPFLEASKHLLDFEAPVQRKRVALLHALEGHKGVEHTEHSKADGLRNASVAVAKLLDRHGQHVPCR